MRRLGTSDLRLLRIFTTVVDCNGFGNAQVALGLSQSTLSSHMTKLEAQLGTRLCRRGRRGFKLTRTGEETYRAALDLFRSIAAFESRMGRVHGRESERLRVGIIDSLVRSRDFSLPGAIAAFGEANPDVAIDLETLPASSLENAVSEGRRDVVIGPLSRALPKLTYATLFEERHALYCGRDHPWFAHDDAGITQGDLAEARFSVRTYRYFDDVYRFGGVQPGASVSSMEAQEAMILSGRFVGYLPRHQGDPWAASGQMRAIRPGDWSDRSVFSAAYDEHSERRGLKERFVEALNGTLRSAPRPREAPDERVSTERP